MAQKAADFDSFPESKFSDQVQAKQHSAEELNANLNSSAQLSHPLSDSVAVVPNFDAPSFDVSNFSFSAEQLRCPVIIEIFCGSARVTASLKLLGLEACFGVDHKTHKAMATAKEWI